MDISEKIKLYCTGRRFTKTTIEILEMFFVHEKTISEIESITGKSYSRINHIVKAFQNAHASTWQSYRGVEYPFFLKDAVKQFNRLPADDETRQGIEQFLKIALSGMNAKKLSKIQCNSDNQAVEAGFKAVQAILVKMLTLVSPKQ